MPVEARQSCRLTTLAPDADAGVLDTAYVGRGLDILDCDTARAMAVDVRDREHALQDEWWAARERRRLPAWRRWLAGAGR